MHFLSKACANSSSKAAQLLQLLLFLLQGTIIIVLIERVSAGKICCEFVLDHVLKLLLRKLFQQPAKF